MPEYTMESEGKTYTFSSDSPLSDADLQAAASQYFGPQRSTAGKIGGIVGEELARTPGRMVEGIKSGAASLADTIMNPKLGDILPLTIGGPVAKGTATGVGQIPTAMSALKQFATQGLGRAGAAGIGRAVDQPGTFAEKAMAGVKSAGMAAAWEAAFSAAPFVHYKFPSLKQVAEGGAKKAEQFATRRGAFDFATKAPEEAYQALKGRVPQTAWMSVPTISTQPITFREATRQLPTLTGKDYEAAYNQIRRELNRLDAKSYALPGVGKVTRQGGKPYAGSEFATRTSPTRFQPTMEPLTSGERGAQYAIDMLGNPGFRGAADVAANEPGPGGMPLGAIPPLAIESGVEGGLGAIARRLGLGGRH